MELVAKYRRYADQCRELAGKMRSLEFEQALEAMAREWEDKRNSAIRANRAPQRRRSFERSVKVIA
jgi:hypothetical protein